MALNLTARADLVRGVPAAGKSGKDGDEQLRR